VLSGEIDVEFDSGQVVTMKQGDVIVMRGVTHCWKNNGTILAIMAFILIDAAPFEAAGEKRSVSIRREAALLFARDRQALSTLLRQQ
jgi:quercetin dioxygenase-like cupin family protein